MRGRRDVAVLLPRRERFSKEGAGAIATVVHQFTRHSRFHERLLVFGQQTRDPLDERIFVPVPNGPFWNLTRTRRYLAGLVRAGAAALRWLEVHNRPSYAAFLRRHFPGTVLALYLHNDPRQMRGARSAAERRELLDVADRIICVSDHIKRCFLEGIGAEHARVVVVRNAIDVRGISPRPAPERRKDIVFIGRTIPDKGPHLLVQAALSLLPQAPEWRLVMVGARRFSAESETEAYERNLQRDLESLGAQAVVTGYVPHAKAIELLGRASIAVVPSLWEDPCPLAPIEAMAAGCALITTHRGGIPEVVGDAGLYLSEESGAGVAQRLRELMSDPARLQEMQRVARARAERFLDIRGASRYLDGVRAAALDAAKGR